MSQPRDKRTERHADAIAQPHAEARTREMDRETLEDGVALNTNDSIVHETDGTHQTQAFRSDYERALPDHYKLVRMIGRGGMSEVFLAEDERLGRMVAIKFLNSEFRRDPERMRRFKQEARSASALNHPNILIIHDIGENEGVQFIVSEFVDGETLGSLIAKGKLPLSEAVPISIQIASALAASHHVGIVHRDVKPDNIMLRRDGSVKVLDFGLAKESGGILFDSNGLEARTLENAATSPGLILGTPQYMSPEQARGRTLDARTDIFSFGVILFEMVTGQQPFPGGSMVDIIAAVISKEPRSIKEFVDDPPPKLVRIVEKALRKNKEERYRLTDDLLSDLRELEKDIAQIPAADRVTKGDKVRGTRPNTVRTFFGESRVRRNALLVFVLGISIAAFVAWWVASGVSRQDAVAPDAMRSVPITNWSSGTGELVVAASFSPDTKMIAFAATKTGSTEIWTKPVAGGEPIQVTKNGFYNQYPVWSPNGQDIAFLSSRGNSNGIWRVSFTGGEQVQIASGVAGSARPVLWAASGKIYFQEGTELFAVSDNTGERSRVTNFEAGRIKPRTIALADDQSTVAYSIREEGTWKVYVTDLSGSKGSEIASSAEQIEQLAWQPDGKSVIFSSSADGTYQVFRSGIGYAKPIQISNGSTDLFVQDVSGDGKILYGSVSETSDLWSIDVADGRQTPLANEVAAEFWPDLSLDGRSVLYQSVGQPDRPYRGTINVKSRVGSSPSMVISSEGFAPVWSNDGQWAAFFRRSDTGISIWRVKASGGDALKLADGSVNPPVYSTTPYLKFGRNHIAWSPDDASVAYSANADGVSNIWLAAADGSKQTMISSNKDAADKYCCPTWVSDGRTVVFTSEYSHAGIPRKKSYRLWSIDIAASEQRMVFEANEPFRFVGFGSGGDDAVIVEKPDSADLGAVPENTRIAVLSGKTGAKKQAAALSKAYFDNIYLSADGRMIAYVTRRDNLTALWVASVNGGTPKQLLAENDPKILFSSLEWAPDGSSVIFGKQTRTNLLSMLSN